MRVRLPSSEGEAQGVHVLFLITIDRLEMPILGYNVIEELVKMSSPADEPTPGFNILSAFKAGFEESDEKQLEALINLIQAPRDDYICTIQTSKGDTVIQKGQVVNVSCRANTWPVSSKMPVLFEPDEMPQWPTGLQIYETLKTVKKGSVSRIEIEVHNTSQHDILLPNRTPLGKLQLVKSVTPMEVRLAREKGLEAQCKDGSCTTTGVRDEGQGFCVTH